MSDQSVSKKDIANWIKQASVFAAWPSSIGTSAVSLSLVPWTFAWLLGAIWLCWTGRLVSHLAAGHLRCQPTSNRRTMQRWFVANVGVSALIGIATLFFDRSKGLTGWHLLWLVVIVVAVSLIPGRQAKDIAAFGLPTGSEWFSQRFGGWFGAGTGMPLVNAVRKLTSRKPGASVGNCMRTVGAIACILVVSATIVLIRARQAGQSPMLPNPTPSVSVLTTRPVPPPVPPLVVIPQAAPAYSYDGDLSETYQNLCGPTTGISPGWDAPADAKDAFDDLVLGPNGVGGFRSGCLGQAHSVSGSSTVWAEGYLGNRLLSVALYSKVSGGCLVLGSAAKPVADLLRSGTPLSCSGSHSFGPADGDAYLVVSPDGTYAFIRGKAWAGRGLQQSYIELGPGPSDAWAAAERLAGRPLLLEAERPGRYVLTELDGTHTRYEIDISQGVRLLSPGDNRLIAPGAALSWTTTPF